MTIPAGADPGSPFTIQIQDTPDPVPSGSQLTYTITMQNTGGAKTTNVTMTDQLNGVGGIGVPPQLQISSSRGSCTQTTTLVTCNPGGDLEGGGTWTVTVTGVVTASAGTVINNTGTITGTKSAQTFTSQTTINTTVLANGGSPLPDLTISKNGPTSVPAGQPMTYTLTVNNIGTANTSGVKVVDTLPAGITAITASGTSLFVCSVSGQTVTCTGGTVNQGANATITINCDAPATQGTITNTAAVDPDNTIQESNELNNTSALVNTSVGAPPPTGKFTINVTDNPAEIAGAGPDPVNPGGFLTYKIFVNNVSGQRGDDVVITDGTQGLVASNIQANMVFGGTGGTLGQTGGCVVAAPQVRCSARTLNAGGTILITITGSVIDTAGSTLLDTATVNGNVKNVGYTYTDSEITTVKPGIDLTITSTPTPNPVCARSWPDPGHVAPADSECLGGLTYTFVLGNSGVNQATNVTVRDPLPAGTVFDNVVLYNQAPNPPATCSVDASNVLLCTGFVVPPESTRTMTLTLVAPAGTGTIVNTVYIDPNNAIFESDETNNTATSSELVTTGIDLVTAKTQNFNPIATSGTETYTITVDNLGPQDATNIRLRDTLPANTGFRDVHATNGFTCSYANGVVECIGGAVHGTAAQFYPPFGGPAVKDTAHITIRIFAQPIVGTMHNEVRVDPNLEIPEIKEDNNIATLDTTVEAAGVTESAFNQLTVTKAQTFPLPTGVPVARNAKVTYVITVGNDGTDPALNITVRDFLPAGAHYIEATGTNSFLCTQVSNVVNCVGGQILGHITSDPVKTATITVSMFAPDTPGTYNNQAIVDPDNTIPEGNEFDNQFVLPLVVSDGGIAPFYDLTVTATQSPANPIARNGVVTYNITVTNLGSDLVNNIKVRDTIPAGSRYIQAIGDSQFLCAQALNGTVECTGGKLAGGASAAISVKIFAPDTPATGYINQILVDPDNTIPEGSETNNSFTVTTDVTDVGGNGAFNDLTILKTADVSDTTPGGQITYTLTVSNLGSDPAQNVAVRDVLPAGEVFVSAADTGSGGAFTCNFANGVVNCTGATIGAAPRTITIVVKAPQELHDATHNGGPLHNEAVVDPDNTIPEGTESNNTSSADVSVTSLIDLKVEKSGPTTASQSDVTDYTIKVTNDKGSTAGQLATGVVMVDPLPVGLIPLATDLGTGNNWACTIDQNPINAVHCIGDLGPGDSVTIKITVFITAEDGRTLDNVACVDPNNTIVENNELNNCSDVGTFVTPPPPQVPDLLVSKNVDSLSTSPGASLQYTISVSNSGDAHALGFNEDAVGHPGQGITVTDTLPAEVDFVNWNATNAFTCTYAAPTLTCHDGGTGLDPGATADITVNVTVKTTADSPITNTAHADPAIAFNCSGTCANESGPKLDNNNSTVTSSIGSSGIDLAIGAITDVPDPVGPGQGLKYTITASNGGTAPASGVVIRVAIPTSGLDFVGASGSNGFNCGSPSSGSLDCNGTLPAGGTTTIIVSFTMHLTGLPADETLTATIDPDLLITETNEGNNTKTQVTTVSTSVCSICVDLVSSQLVFSADPITPSGSTETVTYQLINAGDTATTLNPASDPLLEIGLFTDNTLGSPAVTSPDNTQWPCSITSTGTNFAIAQCKGNLAPGQGLTITLSGTVTGTIIYAYGQADPSTLITEPNETNNFIENATFIY